MYKYKESFQLYGRLTRHFFFKTLKNAIFQLYGRLTHNSLYSRIRDTSHFQLYGRLTECCISPYYGVGVKKVFQLYGRLTLYESGDEQKRGGEAFNSMED